MADFCTAIEYFATRVDDDNLGRPKTSSKTFNVPHEAACFKFPNGALSFGGKRMYKMGRTGPSGCACSRDTPKPSMQASEHRGQGRKRPLPRRSLLGKTRIEREESLSRRRLTICPMPVVNSKRTPCLKKTFSGRTAGEMFLRNFPVVAQRRMEGVCV